MGPEGWEVPDGGLTGEEESWRICPGYPAYSVSNLGRVRYDRTGVILQPTWSDLRKALVVGLSRNNSPKDGVVPWLCLWAFVGTELKPITWERGRGDPVLYKDGNPLNCRADNLQWRYPGVTFADSPIVFTPRQSPASIYTAELRVRKFAAKNREYVLRELRQKNHPELEGIGDDELNALILLLQSRKGLPVGPLSDQFHATGANEFNRREMSVRASEVITALQTTRIRSEVAARASPRNMAHELNPWAKGSDAALTMSGRLELPGEVWYPLPQDLTKQVLHSASNYGRVRPEEQLRSGRPAGRPIALQQNGGVTIKGAPNGGLYFNLRGQHHAAGKLVLVAVLEARKRGEYVPGAIWPEDSDVIPLMSWRDIWGATHKDRNPWNCCVWNLEGKIRQKPGG